MPTATEKHCPGKILGSKWTPIGYGCTYAKKLTATEKHCPGKILGSRLPTIWAASDNQKVANNTLHETSNEWLPYLPSKLATEKDSTVTVHFMYQSEYILTETEKNAIFHFMHQCEQQKNMQQQKNIPLFTLCTRVNPLT